MTVQELIDELMKVKDKSKNVATDSWNTDIILNKLKRLKNIRIV